MASKGGGKQQIVGYRYYMAVHSGISRGPVDEFCEIRVGDIEVWRGAVYDSDAYITIDAPDAFGGDEKEGGIVGTAKVYMGTEDQVVDDLIVDNIEGDIPPPGWRGTCTFFYYGQISSNNPYPKSWKFRVRRALSGWQNGAWYAETARIVLSQDEMVKLSFIDQPDDKEYIIINGFTVYFREEGKQQTYDVIIGGTIEDTVSDFGDMVNFYSDELGVTAVVTGNNVELRGNETIPVVESPYGWVLNESSTGSIYAMNPAHIIYECATDNVWGRGLPTAMIDDPSFRKAADTLYAENFGLCIRWNRDTDIDQFVQLVVDHIGASVYISRETGMLTLKLIRQDYDAATLPAWTFDNGLLDITEDQTSSTDTMYNEVIVEFNDPTIDKIGTVRVQNLASFQALGTLVSQTVSYHGIATATLALKLAQRDLEMHSSNLRRLTLKMSRAAWRIAPGDVLKVSAPTRGIDNMLLRVGEIEEDPITGETLTLKCVQDVFGLPDTLIVEPQESAWKPPDRSARVITVRHLTEYTYFDLADNVPPSQIAEIDIDSAWIKMYARQPNDASSSYDLHTKTSAEAAYAGRGNAGFDATADLVADLSHYATSVEWENGSQMADVALGAVVLIDDEYMRLDAIDLTARTLTVARGVADTIPAKHSGGARIWLQTAIPASDFRIYARSEEVYARLLTRTSSQVLDAKYAYEDSIVIAARHGRPYPPGDLKINDAPFADPEYPIAESDIVLTWTHRDRVMQGNTLLAHQAASSGPEPGTTYTVEVYDYDGTSLLHSETGITGTSWTYAYTQAVADGDPKIMLFKLESVRDGYHSHQYYWFGVTRVLGFDDGFDYAFDGSV